MSALEKPTFRAALRFWFKLGLISFGGPAGQIAIMQTELVERRKWISQDRFLHALNFCMLLPGPEAQQLATYCGWLLHKTWGGIAAGVLFVLPAAVLLWVLSYVYAAHGDVWWLAAFFDGLKPAVLAIVAAALLKIAGRSLGKPAAKITALLAFVALALARAPFPLVVFGAALAGWLADRIRPGSFSGAATVEAETEVETLARSHEGLRLAKVLGLGVLLWAAPLVLAFWIQGSGGVLAQEGLFFGKAAMVTFGGAYAVLPYVAQQAVERFGWLGSSQMMDGLALAETTPGPLIMVVQFVGFMGGWNHPGGLSPLMAGTLAAAMTTWMTFVPCFIWIFAGAPHVERLRRNRAIASALAAVTAAVVGVILNLAVWFGRQVILPTEAGPQWLALGLTVAAFVALHRFKVNLIAVLGACGAAGVVAGLV